MKARRTALAIAAALVAAALAATLNPALSAFNSSIGNTSNTVSTGTQALRLTDSTSAALQCTSEPVGGLIPAAQTTSCPGNFTAASVPASGNSITGSTLTASGSIDPSSSKFSVNSCAAQSTSNLLDAADPLLTRLDTAFDSTGPTPLAGSAALQFAGTGKSFAAAMKSRTELNTQSQGIWFKTTGTTQTMMRFMNTSSTLAASVANRDLRIDSTGHLSFVIWAGVAKFVTTSFTVTDGLWHYAVATLDTGPTTTVATLYVDANAPTTLSWASSPDPRAGWWRIGSDNALPFAGSLSNPSVWPSALTQANVTSLLAQSTQANFSSMVLSFNPYSYWPTTAATYATYAGNFPEIGTGAGASSPCDYAGISVGEASAGQPARCIIPIAAAACTTTKLTLTQAVALGSPAMNIPTVAASQTTTTTIARALNYSSYMTGLQLRVPVSLLMAGFTQTFLWSSNSLIL